MKKYLFISSILIVFSSFTQKRITSNSKHVFNSTGVLEFKDSTAYLYSPSMGIINNNGPHLDFGDNQPFKSWFWISPTIDFTSCTNYYNSVQVSTNNKNFNSDFNVSSNTSSNGFRELFTYSLTGKLLTYKYEHLNSGTWSTNSGKYYTYDNLDRLIVTKTLNSSSGIQINLDSLEYFSTTTNINKISKYSSTDGVTFYPQEKSELTYTGDLINTFNYYINFDENNLTPLEYYCSGVYNYIANNLTSLTIFEVISDVITSTILLQSNFTYNTSNLLIIENQTGTLDLTNFNYTYDEEGFVTKIAESREVTSGGDFYVENEQYCYYENTANIDIIPEMEISVYPNPSCDIINIPNLEDVLSIVVYSLDGKKLISQNKGNEINISHLLNGDYFLEVSTLHGIYTEKIIKN